MKLKFTKSINLFQSIGFLAITLFVISNSIKAQNPSWQWAKSGGGPIDDYVSRTIVDASGNVYVAGSFQSISINIGTVTVNNGGVSGRDVFIAKYDPTGAVQWVQRITGSMSEYVTGLTSDAAGRIYVVGHFISPSISFPPYSAANSNTASPTNDIFVTCINSLGTPQWFYTYGGINQELPGECVYSDAVAGLYVVGTFYDQTLAVGSVTLTNSSLVTSKAEGFLMRFNSNGTSNWGRTLGNAACDEYATYVAVDPSGNPHASGTFQGSVVNATTTIGSVNLVSYGNGDAWLTKYLANGTQSWARNIGSASGDFPNGLAVDASSNVYIAATGQGTMTVGTFTAPNSGGYDAYLGKYNSTGTAQWLTRAFGTGNEYAGDVTLDASGNPYLQGYFDGANCTVGTTAITNSSAGTNDLFLVKYNPSGTYIWNAKSTGTTSEYSTGSTAIDAIGNIYVGGYFDGLVSFSTNTLSTLGSYDLFLSKIGCLTTGILGPLSICAGTSATLSATGATTYSWSTGATTSSIVITPTANAVYTATGTTGSCVGTPATLSVTFLPASVSAGSNLSLLCKQKSVLNATCNPSASSVTWTPGTGLSSASVLTPTATASGNTTYTLNATLSNGCIKSSTVNVSSFAQTPNICQVTVDSLGNNNEIYWEKTLYPRADSFIVYREVSTNVYKRIGGQRYSAFSMYVDTNRSIGPANGDPNLTYYKYKIQIKDSCGNTSPMSLWHETIFIQDQMNGNFNWNMYAIEGTTATPISNYNLKRRMVSTGTETLITSTTGGLANDPSYNSFWPLNVKWFVDAIGFNCSPTAKVYVIKTKTKSNQSNDKIALGISGYSLNSSIKIYPNPATDVLHVDLNGLDKTEAIVDIKNMLGQTVYQTKALNQHLVINTNDIANGVYMINVSQNSKLISVQKIVIGK